MRRTFGTAVRRAWHFLSRIDVASIVLTIIIVLVIAGSIFPQQPQDPDFDPARKNLWNTEAQDRYGGLIGFLDALGVFRLYRSPAFVISSLVLVALTLVCTLNRWRAVWRRAFGRRAICPDSAFDAASLAASLVSADKDGLSATLRSNLRERGFRLRSEIEGEALLLRADRNRISQSATLLTHLGILLLLVGGVASSVGARRERLSLAGNQDLGIRLLPGWQLRFTGLTIERYPDGSPADYTADLILTSHDGATVPASLRPNQPYQAQGVSIYFQGYRTEEDSVTVSLLAVRDPGYAPITVAGFLLLFGMTVSFYLPHCCVFARLGPDGALRLAGQADRRAHDFAREFRALVAALHTSSSIDCISMEQSDAV